MSFTYTTHSYIVHCYPESWGRGDVERHSMMFVYDETDIRAIGMNRESRVRFIITARHWLSIRGNTVGLVGA